MKNRTTALLVALTLGVCASSSAQNQNRTEREAQANSLYQQGIVAMEAGKYDLAKTSFREVLRLYPKHTQARRHLLHLLENRDSLEIGKRKATLKKVIIPVVDLDQATVQESLEMLSAQVERVSNKKVTPNFIVQDPTGGFKGRTVTLRLRNIPAETLLNYIVDQGAGRVRYDNHAIVITPRNPGTSGAAEAKKPDLETSDPK
ncbi:hypothetical protein [Oceaniferula spumae]